MKVATEARSIDVTRHREYTDVNLPNGEEAQRYLTHFVHPYDYTLQAPPFVAPYRLAFLAYMLNSEGSAYSNPRWIVEHPAFREIQHFGDAAIPHLLTWLERDPYVWLIALPVLVGFSPVRPEHRGRTDEMIQDWRQWGIAHGYA
jgi:hypothetical protein